MSQGSSIGEMLKMRDIVAHDVVSSWEEAGLMAITVFHLVGAGVVVHVGYIAITGNSSSGDS